MHCAHTQRPANLRADPSAPHLPRTRRFCLRLAGIASLVLLVASAISCLAQEQVIQITQWRVHAGDNPAYARPDFDDSHWPAAAQFPHMVWPGDAGVHWYRATFQVPPGFAGQQLALGMGPIDEVYDVYINGTLIGRWGSWQPAPHAPFPRQLAFPIPAGLLTGATQHIAIRRWVTGASLGWVTFHLSGIDAIRPPPRVGPASVIQLQRRVDTDEGAILRLPTTFFYILQLFAATISFVLFSVQRRKVEFLFLGIFSLFIAAPRLILIPITASHSISARSWAPVLCSFVEQTADAFALLFLSVLCPKLRRTLRFGAILICILALLTAEAYAIPAQGALAGTWITGLTFSSALFTLIAFWELVQQRTGGSLAIALCLLLGGIGWTVGNLVFLTKWKVIPLVAQAGPFQIDFREIPGVLLVFVTLTVLYLRFRDEQAHQVALDQELAAARRMQEQLLTAGEAVPAGFTVDAVYRPAREVGGDFYRTVPLDDGSLLVILGDVSGKGLDAALLVAVLLGSLASETHRSPAQLLEHLNRSVMGRTAGGFITACCARFYPDGRVTLANAGQISPYIDGREVELENGLPLGISAQATYSETEIRTTKPITFLSDGVVEARSATGELLGFERMAALTVKPAADIADAAQRWGQEDDITVLSVARNLAAQPALA